MRIKILGISGSTRKGNTDIMVQESLAGAKEIGDVETEFISIRDYKIRDGCIACYLCGKEPSLEKLCLGVKDDDVNLIYKKMMDAEGWIIGTPVYWGGITAQLKLIIDRTVCVEYAGFGFRNKVGGVVVTAADRNGGLEYAIADIHHWMQIHDMIVVGVGPERPRPTIGCYWGAAGLQGWPDHVSGRAGKVSLTAVKQDYIGIKAAQNLGKRVAEMARIIKIGFQQKGIKTAWPYGHL